MPPDRVKVPVTALGLKCGDMASDYFTINPMGPYVGGVIPQQREAKT
jgi:hypothetical protein